LQLPITIGKTSGDDVFQVDLNQLPNLFISFSEIESLHEYYAEIAKELCDGNHRLEFAVMVSPALFKALNLYSTRLKFCHITKEAEATSSKERFTNSLLKELKQRKRQALKAEEYTPLVVLVDDIFDWMIHQKRSTTLFFLELLLDGKNRNIHLVGASIRTYRNLLTQLLNITEHPKIRMMLKHEIYISEPLGAELIINSEELFFYKGKTDIDYTRYFHINEGLKKVLF
jgi:hypothetical protein